MKKKTKKVNPYGFPFQNSVLCVFYHYLFLKNRTLQKPMIFHILSPKHNLFHYVSYFGSPKIEKLNQVFKLSPKAFQYIYYIWL